MAVCAADGGEVFSLPLGLFPDVPAEGDIFELALTLCPDEKKLRAERIQAKLDKLFNNNKGVDTQ